MCMFGDNDCRNNIQDLLRRDMWVLPMMGLSAMNVLVILAFEIFVICKATGNSPSRRYVNILRLVNWVMEFYKQVTSDS